MMLRGLSCFGCLKIENPFGGCEPYMLRRPSCKFLRKREELLTRNNVLLSINLVREKILDSTLNRITHLYLPLKSGRAEGVI